MSTFEPVVSVLVAPEQNAIFNFNLGLIRDDSRPGRHRRERSSPGPPGEYGCEAITQWPKDCSRSMRSTEHIWGILSSQTLVDISRRYDLVHDKRVLSWDKTEKTAARRRNALQANWLF